MSDAQKAGKQSITDALQSLRAVMMRYTVLWFLLLLIAVYGFVLYRIITAQAAAPTEAAITDQTQATATPHIDQRVVDQMQSLQDNSQNVKTLFDQARSNPFQE